ncbi:nickel-dependent hydrogenase large subunit [Desulforhopalus vacuolatus]|uniref:Ni/Fe hydrogenase subunit alpha n=1 Tax=Desulforhopalus vacuolatus TaxID=40414 RepID=UPI0019654DF6|nr:nickel-dependent hydrogenase large subunit [Desulforhopalus vacuolatus]MBM9520355.1 nickel-dependent hydrogenase large subunit [Desulforhopalus vacuolatus]
MKRNLNIHINHITRVEGHGSIVLNVKAGRIEKLQWNILEAPRFFEAILRGKHFNQLQSITSRICGICSIGHSLASLKATEAALGVEISEQTVLLRRLALHGENMQSHILHVGYLAAPDLFGADSIIPLLKNEHKAVINIVRIHRLANSMSDLICGRTTHPLRFCVGGFTLLPTLKELQSLREELLNGIDTLRNAAESIQAEVHHLPDFSRETEYIALTAENLYALYEGSVASTDTGIHPLSEYLSLTNEYLLPHSTAKFTRHNRESYMVGALARFNINATQLGSLAKEIAARFDLTSPNYNPFMNTIAQLVEIADSMEDSIAIIDELLARGLEEEQPEVKIRPGRGIGALEVPRGILFHDYTIDEQGNCSQASCIIPTNQNNANIQKDMEALVPTIMNRPQKEIELTLEMLVRAYDPCISCSTHYLNVEFT